MSFLPQSSPVGVPTRQPKSQKEKGRDWENNELSTLEDQVQEHLRNLKVHKSIGLDERHPHRS